MEVTVAKNILLFADGTGNEGGLLPDESRTNVYKQIRQTFEQKFGGGLSSRITDGYAAIVSVWQPGDRIYLFGFSRGAYTARCLAHVLELGGMRSGGFFAQIRFR
jgi:uncharacterized protein (DUF2235 family)